MRYLILLKKIIWADHEDLGLFVESGKSFSEMNCFIGNALYVISENVFYRSISFMFKR